MTTIDYVLDQSDEYLHPLSPSAIRLAQIIASEKSSVEEMVQIVEYDPALTIKILKIANSAFSASQKRISTAKEALIRLGGARILTFLTAESVGKPLSNPIPAYGYEENELWRHSIAAALASELINSYVNISVPGISFTASMLHDIGKVLLGRFISDDENVEIWDLISRSHNPITYSNAEKKVLGFNHAQVGYEIAEKWSLPTAISEAILHHHDTEPTNDMVVNIVRIANFIAKSIGEGMGNEGMSMCADESLPEKIGLSRDNLERVCAKTAFKLKEVIGLYAYETNEGYIDKR